MRNRSQRLLVTLLAVVVAGAAGTAAGYLTATYLTLKEAEHRLAINAASAATAMESYAEDTRKLLSAMNSSPYAFCSAAELSYFRGLLYQSTLLKDAGRMRGGRIECSSLLGNAAGSVAPLKPQTVEADGAKIYWDVPAFRLGSEPIAAVQLGSSYVVTDFRIRREGMPVFVHMRVRMTGSTGADAGAAATASGAESADDATLQQGDTLSATRCSGKYPHCVTASMQKEDAIRVNRSQFLSLIGVCAVTGCAFGLLWSILDRRSHCIEQQLRRAVARGDLQVVYQPIVNLCTGQIAGAEALARWCDGGVPVSPEVFVRVAEEHGFVGKITRFVLNKGLHDFVPVIERLPRFRLSVNVAAADLSDRRFLPMVDAALESTGVRCQNVVFELTETSTARREAAIETIRRLREAGHKVHIDDFGTGYSSLSYLSDLAVDGIKIDRSFTQAIGTESVTVAILPQILALAEALNLQVVAEGIETVQQAAYFSGSARPVLAQGWFFGQPMTAVEFQQMLHCLEPPIAESASEREPTDAEAALAVPQSAA